MRSLRLVYDKSDRPRIDDERTGPLATPLPHWPLRTPAGRGEGRKYLQEADLRVLSGQLRHHIVHLSALRGPRRPEVDHDEGPAERARVALESDVSSEVSQYWHNHLHTHLHESRLTPSRPARARRGLRYKDLRGLRPFQGKVESPTALEPTPGSRGAVPMLTHCESRKQQAPYPQRRWGPGSRSSGTALVRDGCRGTITLTASVHLFTGVG